VSSGPALLEQLEARPGGSPVEEQTSSWDASPMEGAKACPAASFDIDPVTIANGVFAIVLSLVRAVAPLADAAVRICGAGVAAVFAPPSTRLRSSRMTSGRASPAVPPAVEVIDPAALPGGRERAGHGSVVRCRRNQLVTAASTRAALLV
jgi:hypothetical protein